jgi:hypothetical protein
MRKKKPQEVKSRMLEEDYLMREIARFVEAMLRLAGLRKREDFAAARQAAEETSQALLGLRTETLLALSPAGLLALLQPPKVGSDNHQRPLMAIRLLQEAGEIAADEGDPQRSYQCYLKALQLLLAILDQESEADLPDFVPSVDELAQALQDYELPVATRQGLSDYYVGKGK